VEEEDPWARPPWGGPGATSLVVVARDGRCPLSWWGAGSQGVSVHRLEPLTWNRSFRSPATVEGSRNPPYNRRRRSCLSCRQMLELLNTPASSPRAWRAPGARLGNALGGARSPFAPGRASHLVVQALRGWPRWVEPGKPGHPSPLPNVRASQSIAKGSKRRWSGVGLHIPVLGEIMFPDGAAFIFLGFQLPLPALHLLLDSLSLFALPTPHLLLEVLLPAVQVCPPPFPGGPLLPELTPKDGL